MTCGEKIDVTNIKYGFGIAICIICIIGVFFNTLSLIVFKRLRKRSQFYELLIVLTLYDIAYQIFWGVSLANRKLKIYSNAINYLGPYFLYPVSKIVMSGSIYMTVAISAHRFICIVCNPSILQKKYGSLIFILPVLIFSILVNIPTFLNYELKYKEKNGETMIGFKPSALRKNEDFKYYYIYLTQNIVTVLIPAILLLFFNAIIIWKLLQNRKEFNTLVCKKVMSKAEFAIHITSICIVVMFTFGHIPRAIVNWSKYNGKCEYGEKDWAYESYFMAVTNELKYFAVFMNCSFTFFIYFCIGENFRKNVFEILHIPLNQTQKINSRIELKTKSTGITPTQSG